MLSPAEKAMHDRVVKFALDLNRGHAHFIRLLLRVERSRNYRKLGRRNLLEYIQKESGIDSTYSHELNRVVAKALEIPKLYDALESGALKSSHASRIAAHVSGANAVDLIAFASTHTFAEVTEFIAKSNPGRKTRETAKWISGNQVRVSLVLDRDAFELLRRVRDQLAQRQKPSQMGNAIVAGLNAYVEKNCPVKKAERARERAQKLEKTRSLLTDSTTAEPVGKSIATAPELPRASERRPAGTTSARQKLTFRTVRSSGRVPFSAAQKHEVFLRSGGRCTYQGHKGRCDYRRFLYIHHKQAVRDGGTSDPANFTLICSFHHDLVHQLCFPGMEIPYSFAEA